MPQLLKSASTVTLDPDDYFEAVLDVGRAGCDRGLSSEIAVAGKRVRLRFSSPCLQSQMLRALCHVLDAPSDKEALEVFIWSSNDRLLLDRSPWDTGYYWQSGKMLSVRHDRGYLACNPQLGAVSLYDRRARQAAFWVPDERRLHACISGAPLLNLLNWWLAEHGLAVCHAASFGLPEAAVLVVGRGGSGKSTTAFASLATRLGYISDDYAVVEVGDVPTVHSLYSSGKLYVDQLRRHFPELDRGDANSGLLADEKKILFLGETHPAKLLRQAPLKAIFVPQIVKRTSPVLESISAGEAMKALGPNNVLQLPGNQRLKFSMLAALTRALPAYRIQLCPELGKNLELIQSFLGG